MRFVHVSIQVRDIEKSIAFYQEVTGLTLGRRIQSGPREIAFLANSEGECSVELISLPEGEVFAGQGISLGFACDDIEGKHKAAQEAQLQPTKIFTPNPHVKYFFIHDPDTVPVQFVQEFS